ILSRVGYDLEKLDEQTARSETSDNKRHHKYIIKQQYSKQDQILAHWEAKFNTSDPFNLGEPQVELINYFNDSTIAFGEKISSQHLAIPPG
ncbi:MAG: hypothetical protein ACOC0D_07000, partial [Spirochaeta sp.]